MPERARQGQVSDVLWSGYELRGLRLWSGDSREGTLFLCSAFRRAIRNADEHGEHVRTRVRES